MTVGGQKWSRMKIVNNYMTTSLNVLTAEVLTLAESIGLGESTCLEVLNRTPAGRGRYRQLTQ